MMTEQSSKRGWWQRLRERVGRILFFSRRRRRRKKVGYYYL